MSDEEENLNLTPGDLLRFLQWMDREHGPEEVLELPEANGEYIVALVRSYKNQE